MWLSDLDTNTFNPYIFLIQTPSTSLEQYVRDKIRRYYKVDQTTTIYVENKTDLKKVKDIRGIEPMSSDRWFVPIDIDKMFSKELIKAIKESTTCLFYLTTSRYSNYKKAKETFGKDFGFYDMYLRYLKRPDLIYIYDAYIVREKRLPKDLFDFVVHSYSGDIEAFFTLLKAMVSGKEFKSRNQIIEECGLGATSIESYVFDLLKPLSGSAKGLNITIKNRIKVGSDVAKNLSYRSLFNIIRDIVASFVEIKMLLLSGTVYKEIRDIPENFTERNLEKYQRYLWKISEIPYSELVLLINCLGTNAWQTDMDFFGFIYGYYTEKAKRTTIVDDLPKPKEKKVKAEVVKETVDIKSPADYAADWRKRFAINS